MVVESDCAWQPHNSPVLLIPSYEGSVFLTIDAGSNGLLSGGVVEPKLFPLRATYGAMRTEAEDERGAIASRRSCLRARSSTPGVTLTTQE
jgi:hypothetical protein